MIILFIIAQNLPIGWAQSYCTYDNPEILGFGKYGLGFGIDNYCIYSGTSDTVAYDERRFDIWARLGILKKAELELKYSHPTAGLVSGKYKFFENFISSALKLGFGYMKGTRVGYITDYVYDFYCTILIDKRLNKAVKFIYAPKVIYSIHQRDRQEHSDRPPNFILQYGHCIGIALGEEIMFFPEANWLWGKNRETDYIVNQFGIGVNLKIN